MLVIYIFNQTETLKFFILPPLRTFHGILGYDSFRQLDAVINIREGTLTIKNNLKILIKELKTDAVNAIKIHNITPHQKIALQKLVTEHPNLFSEPDEWLTYTTKVVGKIRTSSDSPI